jgi:hypothetical protein
VILAVLVGILAEWLGTIPGCVAALASGVGFTLVIAERTNRGDDSRGGPELAALAALVVLAVLFGHDRPQKD